MTAVQSWFVYYKVPLASCTEVMRRARSVADALSAWLPAAPRVLRKVDDAALATLMEIYEGVTDPREFGAAMAQAVVAAGMPKDLIDTRQVEQFVSTE